MADEQQTKPKSKRGFASMSKEKLRAIASMGGSSVPSDRRSFSQSRDLAIRAGKKGGTVTGGQRTAEKKAKKAAKAEKAI